MFNTSITRFFPLQARTAGRSLFLLSLLLAILLTACSSSAPADTSPSDVPASGAAPTDGSGLMPTSNTPSTEETGSSERSVVPSGEATESTEVSSTTPGRDLPEVGQETASNQLGGGLLNVADTVEAARPAVVSIVSEARIRGVYGDVHSIFGNGTGVIFHPSGLVLTNAHVIDRANIITVTMDDGRQEKATIVGGDPTSDLAILQLEGSDYPYLPLDSGAELRVGDWVIAIGNALALPGGPTVTVGVVSAQGRSLDLGDDITLYDLIQTDTVINPGSSGGPLLNLDGELVGINTAVQRFSQGGSLVEGVGFAINMETANLISDEILRLGRVRWAWMGAFLDDLDPKRAAEAGLPIREGVVVLSLYEGGPSDLAGIQRGDIILAMNDQKVATTKVLTRLLRQEFEAGQEVQVEVFRNGSKVTIPVLLKERPRA